MNFHLLLAFLGFGALVLPLGAQETLSPTRTEPFAPAPAISEAVAPLKNAAAGLSALGLTAQKLTDVPAIISGLTNRTVSVIVNLLPPQSAADPVNFSSKSFATALRSETKKAQSDVIATLSATEVKVGVRFDNIAGFAAEVTVAGLKALQADPRVTAIEPVYVLEPHLMQGIALIHGTTYRSTYNGAGLAIAICDTGIDYRHARLGGGGFPNSKVLGGFDFGDNDADPIPNTQAHGTCCAGIAAGDLGTVGSYIGGVAYNSKLYALKISPGTNSTATTSAIVAAWDWCVTHQNDNTNFPIMVISTSFGGGQFFSTCDSDTPSLTTAANNANAAGITVLASSGNDGYCDSIARPACVSSVISVGAVYDANFGTFQPCVSSASCAPKAAGGGCSTGYFATDATGADKVASYANVASFLTLFAPGNQCSTLDIAGATGYSSGDYYTSFGGTSAACPYAAGAVACLQSAAKAVTGNYLTPAEVRSRLITYGDNVTDTKVAITRPRVNLDRVITNINTAPILNFAAAWLDGGNADQSVDPNECNDLTVTVRNDGFSAATNVTATLSTTTPGVTLLQSDSNYPDIAAAATATNLTAFKINSSLAFVCGNPVNVTLVLHYNGIARTNFFSLSSGGSGYIVTVTGNDWVPGVTDVGNHDDEAVTGITLPFPFVFYSQTFSNAALSSNGNIQFGSSDDAYANFCLPYASFDYVIVPLWDDLITSGGSNGIFTSISGTAPNRIFNIEWRTTYFTGGAAANFEVRLYEGLPRFDFVYGTLNNSGSTVTVGCQKDTGSAFTSFGCNAAVLTDGLQLTFQPACTDGGCVATLANFTANPTNGIAPLTVNFTNLSSNATNYAWDFGDGNFSGDLEPQHTFTNAGTYTVSLTVEGEGGTNSLTVTNFISVLFPPPVANFTADSTNGIAPLTVNFTNLSSNATNYAWDFGDGNFSNDLEPQHTFTNAGTYTVSLTVEGEGGTNALVVTNFITVISPPLLVVNPASLDFGLVLTGALAQATFVVSNAGAALLTGTAIADSEPFAILDLSSNPVTSSGFSLDGATSTNVIIRFAPLTEGAFTNAVVFTGNGGASTNAVTGRSLGLLLLAPAAGDSTNFVFTFPTVPGVNYFVEYTDSLTDSPWQPLQSLAGNGTLAAITNSIPAATQRFFRVTAQ